MSKAQRKTSLSLRLPDAVLSPLSDMGAAVGMTVSEYIRYVLTNHVCNAGATQVHGICTTPAITPNEPEPEVHGICTTPATHLHYTFDGTDRALEESKSISIKNAPSGDEEKQPDPSSLPPGLIKLFDGRNWRGLSLPDDMSTTEFLEMCSERYPNADLAMEIVKAAEWLAENQGRAKGKKKSLVMFLGNWFKKSHDDESRRMAKEDAEVDAAAKRGSKQQQLPACYFRKLEPIV